MGFKSNQRPLWKDIVGNPEGNSIGSPGDLRYSTDTGTLWIKAFGRQTKTGWMALSIGGGGGGGAIEVQGDGVTITDEATILNFTGDAVVTLTAPGEVNVDIPQDWQVMYDVDFRDAHTALGNVDLNSPGASFTYEGIPWTTPAVANGFPVDQVTSTSWGLTSAGLAVLEPDDSRMNATNSSAPSVVASLADIAQNSRTPFDGDPSRKYRAEVYVSAQSGITVNGEGSGVAIAMNATVWGAAVNMEVCLLGRTNNNSGEPFWFSAQGIPANVFEREDLVGDGQNVTIVVADASGLRVRAGWANIFDGTDWSAPGFNDKFIASGCDGVLDTDEDTVGDAIDSYNFHVAHTSPTAVSAYQATIQRFRLLRT